VRADAAIGRRVVARYSDQHRLQPLGHHANPALPADGTGDFRNAHNTFGIVEIVTYARPPPGQTAWVVAPTEGMAQQ
jgi:hypothetical protein